VVGILAFEMSWHCRLARCGAVLWDERMGTKAVANYFGLASGTSVIP